MPVIGDIIQIAALFSGVEGGAIQNIFTSVLTQVAVNSWESVADDVEVYLNELYEDWFENVSTEVESQSFVISRRDAEAGEWNEVTSRTWLNTDGMHIGDSLPSINCATVIAFPGSNRNWGFKNFPPPSEFNVSGGNLIPAALGDLLLTAAKYTSTFVGINTSLGNGVYSLATEQFRGFTNSIILTSVIGSRVTRKEGRGI